MWLTHRNIRCVEIDERVFERLLSFYPEENLLTRSIPSAALAHGEIKKGDLQREANTLFIPWQMFMLKWENLLRHLKRIETNRKDKIRIGQLSTRPGAEGATPNRLIDRYIRSQNFLVSHGAYPRNGYIGALRGKSISSSVESLISHFDFKRQDFWDKSTKERALEYIVDRIEHRQINVALGGSEARLVPSSRNHRLLYKNLSGFCLRDEKVPFIFVNMNMADKEEPAGRRIYTLVYLLVLVGLDIFTITRDWRPGHAPSGRGRSYLRTAHDITSEFLLPTTSIDPYRGKKITLETVTVLSAQHKLTPTATLFRLWKEKCITKEERDALTQPTVLRKSRARSPHIENAVRKINGALVYSAVNAACAASRITPNQAQYILFGRVRRKMWWAYRARVGI